MCGKHHMRWVRHGDPLYQKIIRGSVEERFWHYAVKRRSADMCWPWLGKLDRKGYALLFDGEQWISAHRWAYERYVGVIPDGWTIDHNYEAGCRLKDCVNFEKHLEAVTNAENVDRLWEQRRREGKVSSRYRGVTWAGSSWTAQSYDRVLGRNVRIGGYPTEEEAARARDDFVWAQDGEEAKLNFPR